MDGKWNTTGTGTETEAVSAAISGGRTMGNALQFFGGYRFAVFNYAKRPPDRRSGGGRRGLVRLGPQPAGRPCGRRPRW
ncbi:hypothetical protein [Streptomyces sp. NPDC041003]|uniref:hypothetical protein n=1 Tax=Streptomyces sp. NPDC041003 TaxID=3155730 RepID=UPI0033DFBB7F